MSGKASFGVLAYESRELAEQALAVLQGLVREKRVSLRDAAVVVKGPDGRPELHQLRELSAGEGAISGGVAGLLLGLVLGGPIGMALLGMAGGGALGALDTGIENERMRELGERLGPGHAALCALIEDADWALLRERLAPLGGEILVADLTEEAAAALEQAAGAQAEGAGPP